MMNRNLPTKYKTTGCMATYVVNHPSDHSHGTADIAAQVLDVPVLRWNDILMKGKTRA